MPRIFFRSIKGQPGPGFQRDAFTYLAWVVFAGLGILFGRSLDGQYQPLRVWPWTNLLWLLAFLPMVWLAPAANISGWWNPRKSISKRFGLPLAIGLIFGALDVLVIKIGMHPEPYDALPPFLQPFPYSIFLYASGAFEIEVFYRLVPLTLFGLVGSRINGGKHVNTVLWVGSILTALREPLEQWPDGSIWFVGYALLSGFAMNLWQARLLIHHGFLASLSLRLGHYLLWHILLGVYVQYVELA